MSFRARLTAVCVALVLLAAAFVLGGFFSPQRMEERRAGMPLISLGPSQRISSLDIFVHGDDPAPLVTLRRKGPNLWEASAGNLTYPGSSDRITTLLDGILGLRRGTLVTRDPSRMPDLGVDPHDARLVLIHVPGWPDIGLLVGKRAASGDEEYVRPRTEQAAFLTRSSLGILLGQDSSYWYELRILPQDLLPEAVASVTVSGRVELGGGALAASYMLVRAPGGQGTGWQIAGEKGSVNPMIALAMVSRVLDLEGTDFAPTAAGSAGTSGARGIGPAAAGGGSSSAGLQVMVVTLNGDRYILHVSQGARPGQLLLTTSWSPWTYIVDPGTLARTVFPLSVLLGKGRS